MYTCESVRALNTQQKGTELTYRGPAEAAVSPGLLPLRGVACLQGTAMQPAPPHAAQKMKPAHVCILIQKGEIDLGRARIKASNTHTDRDRVAWKTRGRSNEDACINCFPRAPQKVGNDLIFLLGRGSIVQCTPHFPIQYNAM